MITTATRAEYLGYALESEIRSRAAIRHWYRRHRDMLAWADLERENLLVLRELFRVRRDALRQYRASEAHTIRLYRELKAANDAAWAAALAGDPLPDVPLADAGDHHIGIGR
mgnify:CR=1 FL=1